MAANVTSMTFSENSSVRGTIGNATTGGTQTVASGQAVMPPTTLTTLYSYSNTTSAGPGQINQWYAACVTQTANTTQSYRLTGGILTNPLGTISLSAVKRVIVAIADPNANKVLSIGPLGLGNAAPLCFGNVTATSYANTTFVFDVSEPFNGWAVVSNTTDVLGVKTYSANGASTTYGIWVLGVG